jgi:hypothetical protein
MLKSRCPSPIEEQGQSGNNSHVEQQVCISFNEAGSSINEGFDSILEF